MNWCDSVKSRVTESAGKMLGLPARFMPFGLEQKIFERILTPLFAELIEDGELDFLDGKQLRIEVTDMQKQWHFTLAGEQLQLCPATKPFDLCFSGPMNSFVLLASQKADADTLFFRRQLTISGDTELGLAVKNLVDRLDLGNLPQPFAFGLAQYGGLLSH